MFEAEARWLRRALDAFPPERLSPVLNLGSSSGEVREGVQPWIDAEVFCPLRSRGVETFHVDMRELPGVDIRADLTDAADVRRLGALGPKALLCCNLLEHVLEPRGLAQHCLDLLPAGGLVFVTVPFSYPYHRDPIDTMYRPSPGGAWRALCRRPPARSHDPRGRGVVSRRGSRAAVDSTSAFLPLSRAVPLLPKMEALDGAAILAGRRIPYNLRNIRKVMNSGEFGLGPLGGLRPLYRLHHRRSVALQRPSCCVTTGKISLIDAGALGEQSQYDIDISAIGGHH